MDAKKKEIVRSILCGICLLIFAIYFSTKVTATSRLIQRMFFIGYVVGPALIVLGIYKLLKNKDDD